MTARANGKGPLFTLDELRAFRAAVTVGDYWRAEDEYPDQGDRSAVTTIYNAASRDGFAGSLAEFADRVNVNLLTELNKEPAPAESK